MEKTKRNGMKIAIVVLAVLLGFSLLALAGKFLYEKHHADGGSAEVTDNRITTEKSSDVSSDSSDSVGTESDGDSAEAGGSDIFTSSSERESSVGETSNSSPKKSATLDLYRRNPSENERFNAANLFPGDTETKYYRVRVSHNGDVSVGFRVKVRDGYEKLAEVLHLRVSVPGTETVLYDGPIGAMSSSVYRTVTASSQTVDELEYEICVSLGTEVGNEYRNLSLIADFEWWAEDTDNLGPSPGTSDVFPIAIRIAVAVAAVVAVLLIVLLRRKREEDPRE